MSWWKRKFKRSLLNKFKIGQMVYGTSKYEKWDGKKISGKIVDIRELQDCIGSYITFRMSDGEFESLAETWLSSKPPVIESKMVVEEVR